MIFRPAPAPWDTVLRAGDARCYLTVSAEPGASCLECIPSPTGPARRIEAYPALSENDLYGWFTLWARGMRIEWPQDGKRR